MSGNLLGDSCRLSAPVYPDGLRSVRCYTFPFVCREPVRVAAAKVLKN
ncbi:hypothetical protein BH23CHL5_BH23CHL5_01330 [soil metagenome]